MKKSLLLFILVLPSLQALSQDANSKGDIVKKGISFGPLPVVAFDQDKGFQYGGLLNLFDFGDGSHYPHPKQQWYFEASAYTKGTSQFFVTYDTKHLIPNIRMSVATTLVFDKAMDFYGFNGYQALFDPDQLSAFYRLDRKTFTAKADFVGNIWEKRLFWQAGYYFSWNKYGTVDLDRINKGKEENEKFTGETLYDKYVRWGIIPDAEKNGGNISALRLGIMYDTRDFEAAPSRGIWAEANMTMAPKFLGTSNPFFRYMATFRHYIPLAKDDLVFAYRLNYQGSVGSLPFYVMPVFSTIGKEYDRDGTGGYRTVRGIMRCRVQGLDVAFFNAELRWKFTRFHVAKQNVALGFNAFTDGAMVTRDYDVSYKLIPTSSLGLDPTYNQNLDPSLSDSFHVAAGAGFRIIINQNFIIAVDYAKAFDKRDGKGGLYINTGYLF
ncbi:MAG: outer membrane protein assembly factor [Prevotellaceae bacterium]|jgi:outer membrane protein assembly factor BamA|nr:outer membrane protein assembly factor [Prevotellaceae bacterium]